MISITRAQVIGLLLPLVALLVFAGARLARTGTAELQHAAPLRQVVDRDAAGSSGPPVVVHVVGAVRRAGLYRLVEGARVDDAIRRAGGATGRADLALVNLAAPLVDGQQVIVPARVAPAAGAAGATAPSGTTAPLKVSLAAATVDQLDELPGIGPVTAQKIVEWRQAHGPFASVDDLDAVPGIGEARIEQLRDLVTP
ncbi:MAG: ComEA family DNA-binding protein [Thermoleophilia bacterium]|nr:ComEA family DNA-binding protein [Thermoleophilia bacterium]